MDLDGTGVSPSDPTSSPFFLAQMPKEGAPGLPVGRTRPDFLGPVRANRSKPVGAHLWSSLLLSESLPIDLFFFLYYVLGGPFLPCRG